MIIEVYGEELRELRKQALSTQKVLARKVGVSGPAVSRWENGVARPTPEHAKAVKEFLMPRARRFRKAKEVVRAALQEEI